MARSCTVLHPPLSASRLLQYIQYVILGARKDQRKGQVHGHLGCVIWVVAYGVKPVHSSVVDPGHFDMDPDPRIRTADLRIGIRILLFP